MAAQKLYDSFFVYTGTDIKTSAYDLVGQVDQAASCCLVIGLTSYNLSSVSEPGGGITRLTFPPGVVDITEDATVTGLHRIDASAALAGSPTNTYARLFFYDGASFKEFQFVA